MNNSEMSPASLWQQLTEKNMVTGEMPQQVVPPTPWYIRMMLGFSGWVASVSLAAFIAFLMQDVDDFSIITTTGLLANACAIAIFSRGSSNEFINQFALVINVCGQILIGWALADSVGIFSLTFYVILAIYNGLLLWLGRNFLNRVLCCFFILWLVGAGLSSLGLFASTGVISAVLFVGIWLSDTKWQQQRDLWLPCGYGITLMLLLSSVPMLNLTGFLNSHDSELELMPFESLWLLYSVVYGALVSLIIFKIAKYHRDFLSKKSWWLIVLSGVAAALLQYHIIGTGAALLFLLIGFKTRRKLFLNCGLVILFGALAGYYYLLEITLINKAMILFALSLAMFALLGWQHLKQQDKQAPATNTDPRLAASPLVVVLTGVMVLVLVNVVIYQKEQVLAHGKVVFLELAPVDPRSLMQGDYMSLNFAWRTSNVVKSLLKGQQQDDYLIAFVDQNNVAHLEDVGDGNDLTANQIKIKYRIVGRGIIFSTDAYFFQEGTGQQYTTAKYGEFRLSGSGKLLLTNLRDNEFKVLGQQPPD